MNGTIIHNESPKATIWVSHRLQIRFELGATDLRLFCLDGQPFLSYVEIVQQAEKERQRTEQERQRAEQAEAQAKRLADRLREMGIDADQV